MHPNVFALPVDPRVLGAAASEHGMRHLETSAHAAVKRCHGPLLVHACRALVMVQDPAATRRAKAAALRASLDRQVEAKSEQAQWNRQEEELEDFSLVRVSAVRIHGWDVNSVTST